MKYQNKRATNKVPTDDFTYTCLGHWLGLYLTPLLSNDYKIRGRSDVRGRLITKNNLKT